MFSYFPRRASDVFLPGLEVMLKGLMELIASFNVVDMFCTSYKVRLTNLLLFGKEEIVYRGSTSI
jgi:hypothetical protein